MRDLDFELREPEPRKVQSIFFGGGTPSLFSGSAIGRILETIAARMKLASDAEITLEANPGTADAKNFVDYRAAGVNRMSIGIQSFDDASLRALGRIHGAHEARSAFALARKAGFDNLNIDLMFALPGQGLEAALQDLRSGIELEPEHLSWYHLTLEPNTEFAARPPVGVPDADLAAEIHEAGCEQLTAAAFTHYETSAFARPGRMAAHNLNYWRFGDYLGLGAGAHGKRSIASPDGLRIVRRARHKHPRTYMDSAGTGASIQEERDVGFGERPFEYCMNALRLSDGFTAAQFEARTGLPLSRLSTSLDSARARGLIEASDQSSRIQPSAKGWRYQNQLFELFL